MTTIEVDTSHADTASYVGVRCGEAPGETFLAADTLIHSIAIWRPAIETPYGGQFKLWITGVDSVGVPNISAIILDGPIISVPFGDGVHPIKMEFVLDPPFALPHAGQFYFAVQDYCGGHWDLLATTPDFYAQGAAWRSGISCFEGCYLRPPDRLAHSDLVFRIEFCQDSSTPIRRNTWGHLKMIYR